MTKIRILWVPQWRLVVHQRKGKEEGEMYSYQKTFCRLRLKGRRIMGAILKKVCRVRCLIFYISKSIVCLGKRNISVGHTNLRL